MDAVKPVLRDSMLHTFEPQLVEEKSFTHATHADNGRGFAWQADGGIYFSRGERRQRLLQ
ncbi:MAG TPA: hypothetical protein PKW76_16245 [bacterium]|nr:hypothetical protein [bacterium]HPM99744.1 hypothetical protein [bacterium]